MEVLSPDRRWFAGVKEHNLWLRSTYDDRSVQISSDGVEEYGWDVEGARWSPDSFKLAVKKVDSRQVPKIPMVHWLKATEEVEWVHYTKAGQPIPRTELFVVDVLSKRWIRVDAGEEPDQYLLILGWRAEGSELIFFRLSRDLKKLELMVFNPTSGSTRIVLTETQNTFLQAGPWWGWTRLLTFLEDGERFIWISERDGWNHLYLYGLNGNLIHRLTEGTFPVVQVIAVDEKAGWVYFTAHGDPQHPYDTHLYRVDLAGKRPTHLTETPGQHDIDFAPSKEFFVDTHSGVDRPPAVELRRADGTLLRTLAKANIDALKELKWSPPEEFVVKAADGKTDLYGVLYKPYDFDPKRKYPVIEVIHDGPFITAVPRAFTHPYGYGVLPQALAQLGFISFVVDVRGTAERGKKFQDVIYGNIGRTEIPDHVATLKQLAEKRAYMDLSRVGVVGFSYGGYFAIRALLLAPDVYHVGVAYSPITDMPEQWGLQVFLGPPQSNREAWEYASNLRLAGNLKGELLLVHGTGDDIVPFSHTMKMVEALIQADKPYDLIVLPEQGFVLSGTSERYWQDSVRRYFQEHLKP
jgi:dipeptidyl aminopeptidase/acylaminoacyl peptidase